MALEQWGIIAEIFSAFAVLVSLWFVVLELRRNSAQSLKDNWDSISLRRMETLAPLYEDSELSSIIWRGFALHPRLPLHEYARFSHPISLASW